MSLIFFIFLISSFQNNFQVEQYIPRIKPDWTKIHLFSKNNLSFEVLQAMLFTSINYINTEFFTFYSPRMRGTEKYLKAFRTGKRE